MAKGKPETRYETTVDHVPVHGKRFTLVITSPEERDGTRVVKGYRGKYETASECPKEQLAITGEKFKDGSICLEELTPGKNPLILRGMPREFDVPRLSHLQIQVYVRTICG